MLRCWVFGNGVEHGQRMEEAIEHELYPFVNSSRDIGPHNGCVLELKLDVLQNADYLGMYM